ncbi:MAG TPA: DUF2905 family protein [Geminicoccaceae bacterium]|nr:DUF2905 family protein [Geminicoccaceae bacterium]
MKRSAVLFLVLLSVGTYLWPWLRELGLARLPGDTITFIQGYRLHLPIGTALLITAVISGVWRMLDPR